MTERLVPRPAAGQVLVRVAGIGVNLADARMRSGQYPVPIPLPFVPGFEVTRHVESVGPVWLRSFGTHDSCSQARPSSRPTRWRPMRSTRSCLRTCCCRCLTDATSSTRRLCRWRTRSPRWPCTIAAPCDRETVLVHAAGSGVGLATVGLAVAAGAEVVALASTSEKLELARAAGAAVTLPYLSHYPSEELRDALRVHGGADLLIDSVGGETLGNGLAMLRGGGRAVCSDNPATPHWIWTSIRTSFLDSSTSEVSRGAFWWPRRTDGIVRSSPMHWRWLSTCGAAGALPDPVVHRLPLSAVAEAHRAMTDRSQWASSSSCPADDMSSRCCRRRGPCCLVLSPR